MPNVKDVYTRNNIKSDILKLVIMRLDISGVVKFEDFVEKLSNADFVHKSFKKIKHFIKTPSSSLKKANNPGNGTMPTFKDSSSDIYRFVDCTLEDSSNAYLDVTKDAIILTVSCDGAYNGSKRYTDFMVTVVRELLEVNSYISLERVGIRKIDGFDAENLEGISEKFDDNFVVKKDLDLIDLFEESTKTSVYHDCGIQYNVVQHIAKKDDGKIKVVFDVDSYIVYDDSFKGESMYIEQLRTLMCETMQDKMFEFFKNVAAESYLASCKIKD